jgi:hypothetical protein
MTNPLAKHFRQPAIYIKLPSNGKFYPPNTLIESHTGEYPVYPMTAMDEISYRTPDALFNGEATADVIQSCVPNIKSAWEMPGTDFDSVLIAIRIATYGNTMEIESECPHCTNKNEFEADLRYVLGGIQDVDFTVPLTVGGLEIYFKPLNYREIHENQISQFDEQRSIATIANTSGDERAKLDELHVALKKLSRLSMNAIANSIHFIKTDESAVVTERAHINEYVEKCDSKDFAIIRDYAIALKEKTEIKPLQITCQNPECQESYETPFTLDSASFFGQSS